LRTVIRILRIINRFNLGGPTFNATYLSRYLPARFRTTLLGGTPMPHEQHSGFIADAVGQPYVELKNMSRSLSIWGDIRSFLAIVQHIRAFRPHIVHTHAAKAGLLGRLAALLFRVPIRVHTYHGHVFSGYFSPAVSTLVQWVERQLAKGTHAIVAISESQKKDLVEIFRIAPAHKVHVIPLGLDLQKFTEKKAERRKIFRDTYNCSPHTFVFGVVGRLTAIKNHKLLFEAFAAMPDEPMLLVVIGDGELRASLEAEASRIHLSSRNKRIQFTSWIKAIHEVLPGIDAVVLSSDNEGTPVSLIEAQAAGVPVVATRVGGVSQCMQENETGLLVEAKDPKALSEAMLTVKENQMLREQMAQKGPAFVLPRFGHERLVGDMAALYDALLKSR
jgi:glycosyltransferase involved in cell wall biosynthesis